MAIDKAAVLDSINEVIEALAEFSDGVGRQVELVVRTDGTADLMGASDTCPDDREPDCFEQLEQFDSIEEMLDFLTGEAPGCYVDGEAPEESEDEDVVARGAKR